MNFFKIIFITILSLLSSFACYADTDSATQNTTSATSVLENTNNNSVNADVPLNNPFSSDTGAGSEAVEATTIEYFIAPVSSSFLTNCATVERF